jgi:hypothetical protein
MFEERKDDDSDLVPADCGGDAWLRAANAAEAKGRDVIRVEASMAPREMLSDAVRIECDGVRMPSFPYDVGIEGTDPNDPDADAEDAEGWEVTVFVPVAAVRARMRRP